MKATPLGLLKRALLEAPSAHPGEGLSQLPATVRTYGRDAGGDHARKCVRVYGSGPRQERGGGGRSGAGEKHTRTDKHGETDRAGRTTRVAMLYSRITWFPRSAMSTRLPSGETATATVSFISAACPSPSTHPLAAGLPASVVTCEAERAASAHASALARPSTVVLHDPARSSLSEELRRGGEGAGQRLLHLRTEHRISERLDAPRGIKRSRRGCGACLVGVEVDALQRALRLAHAAQAQRTPRAP